MMDFIIGVVALVCVFAVLASIYGAYQRDKIYCEYLRKKGWAEDSIERTAEAAGKYYIKPSKRENKQ